MATENTTNQEAKSEPQSGDGLDATPCSAVDLLRSEAERLGGVMTSRAADAVDLIASVQWAYSVSAAWLESRKDSSCIRRWEEVETTPDHLLDAHSLQDENNQLKEALMLACQWGIHSDGHSAEVSDKLRNWVIAGMKGEAPKAPDYYSQNV